MEIYRSDEGTFIWAVFHLTTLVLIYLFGISALSFAVFGTLIFFRFHNDTGKENKMAFIFYCRGFK